MKFAIVQVSIWLALKVHIKDEMVTSGLSGIII